MMHYPDLRSYECAFHLILQVSGRAGRREQQGKVLIQTSNPKHPLFKFVVDHSVIGFLDEQLSDRELHHYPPFTRLVEITIKHADKNVCRKAAERFAEQARKELEGVKIMGPGEPMVSKIRNEFLNSILLKIPRNQGKLNPIKQFLLSLADQTGQDKLFRSVKIVF